MAEKSNLDAMANLPDRTAAAQSAPHQLPDSAEDLRRGYSKVVVERTPLFSADSEGGATSVGDPWTYGGFLGRPRGMAR